MVPAMVPTVPSLIAYGSHNCPQRPLRFPKFPRNIPHLLLWRFPRPACWLESALATHMPEPSDPERFSRNPPPQEAWLADAQKPEMCGYSHSRTRAPLGLSFVFPSVRPLCAFFVSNRGSPDTMLNPIPGTVEGTYIAPLAKRIPQTGRIAPQC